MSVHTRRWCFADQLGPHFLDEPDHPVLLLESEAAFARRRFHRRKAHLVVSALRHRAAELGDQATFVQTRTYREALDRVDEPITVYQPTSWENFYRDARRRFDLLMDGNRPAEGRWNFDEDNREPLPAEVYGLVAMRPPGCGVP